jgi:hypothetical protein
MPKPLRATLTRALRPLMIAALAGIAGCGGGGGSPVAGAGSGGAAAATLSGTVAVGAPMVNATVVVKDANGDERTAAAAADGSYSGIDVAGLTAPFRVQACGLVEGSLACYYAVVDAAGRANVTPLTNATVSLALGTDAATLFDNDTAAPSRSAMDAQKQKLMSALQPVITAVLGSASIDFATTTFNADRTGMDKLLDAVRISTGSDGGTPFVQLEGRLAGGSVYMDQGASATGSLSGDSAKLGVSMAGISTLFGSLSGAIGAADASTCASRMTASLFDDDFYLKIEQDTAMHKGTVAGELCALVDGMGFLGGVFADPVIKDCDLSGADKLCTVTFNLVKDDSVMSGAELAVVLRSADSTWRLLGQESIDQIHVNANIARQVRVDRDDIAPSYTRAISFDIGTTYVGAGAPTIASARVYQRDAAGTGWDSTPLAELTLSTYCQSTGARRLSIVGSASCSSTWYQLDNNSTDTAAGDVLIDNFFKRGRQVKIELFSDNHFSTPLASHAVVYKRIDGVPLKSADLPGFPWLELSSSTRAALQTYDGGNSGFAVAFELNRKVGAKDVSFSLAGGTQAAHDNVMPSASGPTSLSLSLSSTPADASETKIVSLYGRTREQMGVQASYVSCGGASHCGY